MDEDAFVFPDAWRKQLHPRRGGALGVPVKLDKKALAVTDALVAEARAEWVDLALRNSTDDATVAGQARRALDGEVSAIGAAAIASAASARHNGKLPKFADAWVLRHGIGFAAVAAAKVGMVFAWPPHIASSGEGHTDCGLVLLRRMRALLAECSDADYAAAVAALREVRDCCVNCKVAAAYLVPGEVEWVTDDPLVASELLGQLTQLVS